MQAARTAMQAQAQTRMGESSGIRTVVAMGEDSFRCLGPPEVEFATARGQLGSHTLLQRDLLATGSAAACLEEPLLKAPLWRDLQPLLTPPHPTQGNNP